jgi:photosystem II stability/assembly factor-like uncharacterized protein
VEFKDIERQLAHLGQMDLPAERKERIRLKLREQMRRPISQKPRRRLSMASLGVAVCAVVLAGIMTAVIPHRLNSRETTGTDSSHATNTSVTTPFETNPGLQNIQMVSSQVGYGTAPVAGTLSSRVFRTTDGGHSWTDVTPSQLANNAQNVGPAKGAIVHFLDTKHGFVVVSMMSTDAQHDNATVLHPTVFATGDGGATWTESVIPTKTTFEVPIDVEFVSPQTGFVLTKFNSQADETPTRQIYRTTDGGKHWTLVSTTQGMQDLNDDSSFNWIRFINQQIGFTLSEFGPSAMPSLMRTTDGGRTWSRVQLPASPSSTLKQLIPPTVFPNGVVLVAGWSTDGSPSTATLTVYRSTDFGRTFRELGRVAFTPKSTTYEGGFPDESHGWFWIGGNLVRTNDGGRTLLLVHEGAPVPVEGTSMIFVDANTGYAVGQNGLWTTHDGGASWTLIGNGHR